MLTSMGAEVEVDPDSTQERYSRIFRYAQIGRCISSVTHDLNNYLGAIMAYAELVGMDSNLTDESNRMLGEIVGAVRKSSTLVNNLTDVARKERADIRIIDPASLMERVLDLRRYDMKVGHVTLATEYAPDLASLTVDLPKMQQALMYLVSNAIEAVESEKVKRLDVRVLMDDRYVVICFRDSAPQVPSELRDQIFEPYFTTKGVDHVGLGLTSARSTVKDHNGELSYNPDDGFVVCLPLENRYSKAG